MPNSKFTLYVSDKVNPSIGTCLRARVFDYESLWAVLRGIDSGIFGHYGRRRYFLVPVGDLQLTGMLKDPHQVYLTSESSFQLHPNGGKLVNPVVLGWFAFDLWQNKK